MNLDGEKREELDSCDVEVCLLHIAATRVPSRTRMAYFLLLVKSFIGKLLTNQMF